MAGMVNPSETYTAWSIGEGAHEVTGLKPMLNPEEQVALLKAKGRLVRAMRRGASRGRFGPPGNLRAPRVMPQAVPEARVRRRRGKYVRLDFADLLALDALDDELRKAFLAVSQDVERLAKTSMVTRASRLDDEDGYGIVADFMRAQQRRYRSYIERDLSSRMSAGIVRRRLHRAHHRPLPRRDARMGVFGGGHVRNGAGLLPVLLRAMGRRRHAGGATTSSRA